MKKLKTFESFLGFGKEKVASEGDKQAENIQQHLDIAIESGIDWKFNKPDGTAGDDQLIRFNNGDIFGFYDNSHGIHCIHYNVKNTKYSIHDFDENSKFSTLVNQWRKLWNDKSVRYLDKDEASEIWDEIKPALYSHD